MISSLTARAVARGAARSITTTTRTRSQSHLVTRQSTLRLPWQQPQQQQQQQQQHKLLTTVSATTTTASSPSLSRPVRPKNITAEHRARIRAARKERATAALQQAQGGGSTAASATADGAVSSSSSSSSSAFASPKYARYWWYLGLGLPTVLITWGLNDPENSPPAKLAQAVGLADLIGNYTSHIAAPVYDKLLPDWADVSVLCVF